MNSLRKRSYFHWMGRGIFLRKTTDKKETLKKTSNENINRPISRENLVIMVQTCACALLCLCETNHQQNPRYVQLNVKNIRCILREGYKQTGCAVIECRVGTCSEIHIRPIFEENATPTHFFSVPSSQHLSSRPTSTFSSTIIVVQHVR